MQNQQQNLSDTCVRLQGERFPYKDLVCSHDERGEFSMLKPPRFPQRQLLIVCECALEQRFVLVALPVKVESQQIVGQQPAWFGENGNEIAYSHKKGRQYTI
jgi:hypothetical protein